MASMHVQTYLEGCYQRHDLAHELDHGVIVAINIPEYLEDIVDIFAKLCQTVI